MTNYGCSSKIKLSDKRHEMWKTQRETRGFDDTELWNLDNTIAQFILPRLKVFKEIEIQHGENVEWIEELDKIINVFQLVVDDGYNMSYYTRIKEGLLVFAEHFTRLWN